MSKGFTLMEILAVMLVIALIASFALPALRSVRSEAYYHRAKTAGIKLAEAIRSYYRDSKGFLPVTGEINGDTVAGQTYTCDRSKLSGVPGQGTSVSIEQLFACGYLSTKDFAGLPYKFSSGLSSASDYNGALVRGTGQDSDRAGRYKGKTFIIARNMAITEPFSD
ncbi:MAG: type II secretion system protein [Elusimicrobiaceae bacterium]|nr:type II secretion system protein [Elusimicrobiaceae bacterium]